MLALSTQEWGAQLFSAKCVRRKESAVAQRCSMSFEETQPLSVLLKEEPEGSCQTCVCHSEIIYPFNIRSLLFLI